MLVDRGAPSWLFERFSLASPVSLAAFTVFDGLQQLIGRGGLLEAVLQKPPESKAAVEGMDRALYKKVSGEAAG